MDYCTATLSLYLGDIAVENSILVARPQSRCSDSGRNLGA